MGRKSNAQKAAEAAAAANAAAKAVSARQESNTAPLEPSEEPSENTFKAERVEPRNDRRDMAMDELLASRGEAEQTESTHDDAPAKEKPVPAEKQEAEPEVNATPEAGSTEPQPEEQQLVKVKVDGEEFSVPKEEVDSAGGVANYQRERATENRLRRANETLSETRKAQAQIAEWLSNQMPKQATETDDQYIMSRMDILRFGTQEESTKAMREILGRTNKQIDENSIIQIATNRIKEDAAVAAFKTEFQDIVANPLLLDLAMSQEAKKKKNLTQIPDWHEFYRSIGNEIRSVIGRPNQNANTRVASGNTSQPDKEERKSSIVNLPTAASSRATVPEESKPESREDVLNDMRKARGFKTG